MQGLVLAAVLLGLDRQGWIAVFSALLLDLITLCGLQPTALTRATPTSISWEQLPSLYRSKQEFLASLPPWRRLLQNLNLRHQFDPCALSARRVRV
jgi:hypothetical protein